MSQPKVKKVTVTLEFEDLPPMSVTMEGDLKIEMIQQREVAFVWSEGVGKPRDVIPTGHTDLALLVTKTDPELYATFMDTPGAEVKQGGRLLWPEAWTFKR